MQLDVCGRPLFANPVTYCDLIHKNNPVPAVPGFPYSPFNDIYSIGQLIQYVALATSCIISTKLPILCIILPTICIDMNLRW